MARVSGRSWVVGVALAAAACTSNEDRCETICEWLHDCVSSEVNCSDQAEIDECAEELDDLSDDCSDALDGFTDCLEENDNECSDVESNCQGEAAEFYERCEGELDSNDSDSETAGGSGGTPPPPP